MTSARKINGTVSSVRAGGEWGGGGRRWCIPHKVIHFDCVLAVRRVTYGSELVPSRLLLLQRSFSREALDAALVEKVK